jgi:hypothetical protein
MNLYRYSNKPHLPFVTAYDNKGEVYQAPFHSETKDGKIRYDFSEAGRLANEKGGFISYAKTSQLKELDDHHGIKFRNDVFTDGGSRLAQKNMMIMTYTPEIDEDDDDDDDDDETPPPTEPKPSPTPTLTRKRVLRKTFTTPPTGRKSKIKSFKSFVREQNETIEDYPIENLKNRRGEIGRQGVCSDQMGRILTGICDMKNIADTDTPTEMVEKFKQDKAAQDKLISHVKTDPISVTEMPEGMGTWLHDGHHRATLLHSIGQTHVPAKVKRY